MPKQSYPTTYNQNVPGSSATKSASKHEIKYYMRDGETNEPEINDEWWTLALLDHETAIYRVGRRTKEESRGLELYFWKTEGYLDRSCLYSVSVPFEASSSTCISRLEGTTSFCSKEHPAPTAQDNFKAK